ncbi:MULTISPECIES: serine hydrolase [Amycolatopsis]|uniref:Uncharacterized protein n=1 Tax=Amycolatopsis albidoflavus TaxID=102226 RepID=A0ABW5HW22_9PSEU
MVYDRVTNTVTDQREPDTQFRSASVVKLLIALDYLWTRGLDSPIPPADLTTLQSMLRRSDDAAASRLWVADGWTAIVARTAIRLGLQHTEPPPDQYRGKWGYTATTPADTVAVYRYILEQAPSKIRDFMLSNLRQVAKCAADGWNQYFGIPTVFPRPWAIKQGWSNFGTPAPGQECTSPQGTGAAIPAQQDGVDITRVAMHTSGVIGDGDTTVIAVFTLQPKNTPWGSAIDRVNQVTRSLRQPDAAVLKRGGHRDARRRDGTTQTHRTTTAKEFSHDTSHRHQINGRRPPPAAERHRRSRTADDRMSIGACAAAVTPAAADPNHDCHGGFVRAHNDTNYNGDIVFGTATNQNQWRHTRPDNSWWNADCCGEKSYATVHEGEDNTGTGYGIQCNTGWKTATALMEDRTSGSEPPALAGRSERPHCLFPH